MVFVFKSQLVQIESREHDDSLTKENNPTRGRESEGECQDSRIIVLPSLIENEAMYNIVSAISESFVLNQCERHCPLQIQTMRLYTG